MSVLAASTDAALAYIVKPVLDGIFIEKNKTMLKILPFVIIILYFTKGSLRFGLNYTLRYMGQKVVQRFRDDLFVKILSLPISYFNTNSTGTLMSRNTNDVSMLQTSVPTIVSVVRDVLSVVGLVGFVFYLNPKMALITVLVYPIFFHPFIILSRRIRKYSKKIQVELGMLTTVLQETFSGIRVVKAFAQEKKEAEKFAKTNAEVVKIALKATIASEAVSPMMETVSSIGIAGIVAYGGFSVISGSSTTGDFFSFLAAVIMLYEPAKRLGNANSTIQQAMAAAERVFEIFEEKNDIQDKPGALICDARGKDVEFRSLTFRYSPDGKDVLKDINLKIPSGYNAAFVGHSGAGKSTLANLIPRFYEVTEGEILIGGMNIKDYKVHSLRENIAYVSQDPFLFNDTVAANVAYSSETQDFESVMEACKAAYAHDFIMQLPNGYDTVIGERGVLLSGGQKQRLTIARALFKNSPLLILDEATSSLDTESEREVQKALENLLKGRTSFVIAHRLSTVINSDMIVVLDNGAISQLGKHDELLENSEIYRKLYLNQQ
jgi:subfamily B ATP-binding cassette protein MsbA